MLPPLLTKSSSLLGFGSSGNLAMDVPAASSVSEQFMMLGRVICYHADSGMYDILDVDDSKKYLLPERQVIVLDLIESQRKLCKAEAVFALYPDTTSFYPATVSHAPRRSAMGAEPSVIVQFNGDEDATGKKLLSYLYCASIVFCMFSLSALRPLHSSCGTTNFSNPLRLNSWLTQYICICL